MKTFDPSIRHSEDQLRKSTKRFEREVAVQARLPSHVVLAVLDSDLRVKPPWFTMPLASKNFTRQVEDDRAAATVSPGPLSQILEALEEVHRLGYVHRDLKPPNILCHDGRWKLSDFGLVQVPDGTTRLTSTSSAWGTREYAAPEQSTEFRDVTAAADIYAFGCILHDIVDGGPRVPFGQYSVPGPLAPVVEKCTEADPSRRFTSIGHLRSSLLTILTSPVSTTADQEAQDWASKLADAHWKVEDFERLLAFVRRLNDTSEEADVIFRALTEQALGVLHGIDPSLWTPLARFYCQWARGGFEFAYCDVVAGHLVEIFTLGDLATKADAVLAAVELAESHNRWYVMRRVVEMCSPSIDDDLAERIGIEIGIEEAESGFRTCVDKLSLTKLAYHPRIAAAMAGRPKKGRLIT